MTGVGGYIRIIDFFGIVFWPKRVVLDIFLNLLPLSAEKEPGQAAEGPASVTNKQGKQANKCACVLAATGTPGGQNLFPWKKWVKQIIYGLNNSGHKFV